MLGYTVHSENCSGIGSFVLLVSVFHPFPVNNVHVFTHFHNCASFGNPTQHFSTPPHEEPLVRLIPHSTFSFLSCCILILARAIFQFRLAFSPLRPIHFRAACQVSPKFIIRTGENSSKIEACGFLPQGPGRVNNNKQSI